MRNFTTTSYDPLGDIVYARLRERAYGRHLFDKVDTKREDELFAFIERDTPALTAEEKLTALRVMVRRIKENDPYADPT